MINAQCERIESHISRFVIVCGIEEHDS